jgi:Domain of unknown function (DUF3806)
MFRRIVSQPAEASPQTIEEPNEAELDWIGAHLATARWLLTETTGSDAVSPTLEQLDIALEGWLAGWLGQPESDRDDPNQYINAFGIAFGQRLVDGLGFEWKVVTDADGTEMAVVRQPGEMIVFPANLVAKRVVAGETGFMAPLYANVARTAHELAG